MVKNTNLLGYRYRNNGKPLFALSNVQKKAKSEIERKITDGVYSFELVSCPICEKQNGYELLAEKDRYGLPCNTVICKTCGLLITNPAMDKDSLTQFYSEDYRELYTGSAIAQTYFFSNQYKQGKQIVDFFLKNTDISFQNKFVIEVGCGAGGILSAFKEERAEVLGLDLGADYLEYGIKKHDLCLQQGSIETYTGKKPDIIIYSHVLEHAKLPNELLSIQNKCHENTLIYIEVPGLLSIRKSYADFMLYLQNAHLFHFSLGTLTNLLSKYGFTLVHGDENIRSIFRYTGMKHTLTTKSNTNDYNTNVNYLIRTEKFRIFYKIKKKFLREFSKIYHKILK